MIGLVVSIFLPLLIGGGWLRCFWREAHWAAIVGYGYLLGIFFVTLTIRLVAWIGLELSFSVISIVLLCVGVFSLVLRYLFGDAIRRKGDPQLVNALSGSAAGWQRILFFLLLAVLLVRYGGIFLEVIWRPLFAWDGWMNWAPKARIWFDLGNLAPFVDPVAWRGEASLNGAYTLGNWVAWDYPITVPLIQLWSAMGLGHWRDNYIYIPWFFVSVAIGLAFYSQTRMLGAKPHVSMLVTYILLSMPFLNVHTALAGYADLWMAAFYCLAGMALLNWVKTRSFIQFVLFVLSSIACVQMKSPGILWVLTLIPVLVLAFIPGWSRSYSILAVVLLLGAVFLMGGVSIDIPSMGVLKISKDVIEIPGFMKFPLEYHAVWPYVIKNMFQYLSWNLYFYGITFLLILLCVGRGWSSEMLLPLSVIVLGGGLIFIVFFFTHRYIEAVDSTTINRAMFHMVPMSIFSILYLYILREEKLRTNY